MGHELFELRCGQARRRAAADVEGADMQPAAVSGLTDGGQLLAQFVHIGLHEGAGSLIPHRARHKAAIAAPRRAERNACVDAAIHWVSSIQHRLLQVGNAEGQCKFFRCAGKMVKEPRAHFFFGRAAGAHIVDDAHRAHTGHHAPGRRGTGGLAEQAVQ